MAGLVPPIHDFSLNCRRRTWMPGTPCAKTRFARVRGHDVERWSSRPAMMSKSTSLLRLACVLDGFKGLEFDVVELAVDLLDLADVDVLHDVAGFRVDRDRAARAFPLHPLHGLDQGVAVGLAAGLLQRFIDQVDPVIAAHRHEARAVAEGLLV